MLGNLVWSDSMLSCWAQLYPLRRHHEVDGWHDQLGGGCMFFWGLLVPLQKGRWWRWSNLTSNILFIHGLVQRPTSHADLEEPRRRLWDQVTARCSWKIDPEWRCISMYFLLKTGDVPLLIGIPEGNSMVIVGPWRKTCCKFSDVVGYWCV